MTHNSEDELLAYALEVLATDKERADIAAHVAVCSQCRLRLEDLQKDIETIAGVRPRQRILRVPVLHTPQVGPHALLRAAALIVLGIFVGLGASKKVHHEPDFVSPAYVTLYPQADSISPYAVSDATDIPVRYYEQVLEQGR